MDNLQEDVVADIEDFTDCLLAGGVKYNKGYWGFGRLLISLKTKDRFPAESLPFIIEALEQARSSLMEDRFGGFLVTKEIPEIIELLKEEAGAS